MNDHEFYLNGWRYALWPQWTNNHTQWTPFRQSLHDGHVESFPQSFQTEGMAYNHLLEFGCALFIRSS